MQHYDLILENLIDVKKDGSIHLNMDYFAFTYDKVMTNQKFSELFGIKRRDEDDELKVSLGPGPPKSRMKSNKS